MLGVLKTWWSRKSFVFFLRIISLHRSMELARMKQRLTRWLPARPHTCPLIVYPWNYLSCFPQLAASNQNSTAGFSNRKGTSPYTLNPTVTRRNYTAHVPLAPYTCSDIRTHRMHTPCVLYTTPARTVRANRAHRTRTPRAPYAHTARTVRTPRTHTPHAHPARTPRTPRTHTPHAPYAHPARTHRTPRAHPFSYQNGRVQVKTLFSPFLDLANYVSIYLIYLSICLSIYLSYVSIYLIYLSICLSIYLSKRCALSSRWCSKPKPTLNQARIYNTTTLYKEILNQHDDNIQWKYCASLRLNLHSTCFQGACREDIHLEYHIQPRTLHVKISVSNLLWGGGTATSPKIPPLPFFWLIIFKLAHFSIMLAWIFVCILYIYTLYFNIICTHTTYVYIYNYTSIYTYRYMRSFHPKINYK